MKLIAWELFYSVRFAHPMELAVANHPSSSPIPRSRRPRAFIPAGCPPIRTRGCAHARVYFLSSFLSSPFLLPPLLPSSALSSLRDGSFSATITPEIFLRLMQELCFRRFARCFAPTFRADKHVHTRESARERADGGVHLQVRLAAWGGKEKGREEEKSGLEIGRVDSSPRARAR